MYFEKVIELISPFMSENGYAYTEGGVFCNEAKKVKIAYNGEKKVYELYAAQEQEEYKLLSAYLFDETQTEKDTEAVVIDFTDTLMAHFGIKKKPNSAAQIELPNEFNAEKVTVGGFTQKLLAIFPQYKETYRAHVAEYGKFLPVEFCSKYFIPSAKELIMGGNKRQVKKFFDTMTDMFIAADSETTPLVVALVSACVYDNDELLALVKEQTAECESFYTAVLNFSKNLKHNKKLRAVL